MNYVSIFHANLNYAFLEPDGYEECIRAAYETIFDVFREKHPDAKYTFEASGYTIEQMGELTPDVLEKLKDACASGQCEFMGSPYSHPIMANVPEEDGRWSNEFAMRTYDKYLGFRPVSAWNPECTWKQYVPQAFRDVGYEYLTLDFESFMISNDKEYGWVERNRATTMNWGGNLPWYDLDPDCKFLHQPFKDIVPGLGGMCRSDRLAGRSLNYFVGGMPLQGYIDTIKHWSGKKDKGSLIIIADDAEYVGTTGYFYIKHEGDYSKTFNRDPLAAEKLDNLIAAVTKIGPMITFKEACEAEAVEEPFFVEDYSAWHRTYSHAWGQTPEALRYDAIVNQIRDDYKENVQMLAEKGDTHKELVEKFWYHLTNSENSDGRWPPPPRETCAFNREWVEKEITATQATLADLKKAIGAKADPAPKRVEEFFIPEGLNAENMSLYQLQSALYKAYEIYDEESTRDEGRKWIQDIYVEYTKRGLTSITSPRLKFDT